MVVSPPEEAEPLPSWFLVEIVRDLPRLVEPRDAKPARA